MLVHSALKSRLLSASAADLSKIAYRGVSNEPILQYIAGSPERAQLEYALCQAASATVDVPIVIGEESICDGKPRYQVMPHDHCRPIAKYYHASEKTIQKAICVATEAQKKWDRVPLSKRLAIWEKGAQLMAGKYRQALNAATMLGQSKTVIQAEIDSACELIDFIRFNNHFLVEAGKYQPLSPNPKETVNSMRFRGIDGFIAAIAPFNFTAIGGNLSYTPALMGNGVIWKPSDTAILSNWVIFTTMLEAGVPPGVVNFVPADGPVFGKTITSSPFLAGINFTGSVPTFNWIWQAVGKNINNYVNYPRLIGECGGKNFHFVHQSADVQSVVTSSIRSAFEYCGQKCSALSRMYVPNCLYNQISCGLIDMQSRLQVGDVCNFKSFMGAVIDSTAFDRIVGYIEHAKKDKNCEIIAGGAYDKRKGYFIEPTIIRTTNPHDKLMTEEIFGPVLTIYVYDDCKIDDAINLVCNSTKFALTGAVFAQDKEFVTRALEEFKMAAGNFYINDKCTGSVVGQQPFGGGRMSGTNDKAGGNSYILRWTSPQSIKETFVPLTDVAYPYMCD